MFSFCDFIKDGFLGAVGNQPDYWIKLNAAGYAEKGTLTESDLAEIQAAIDRKNQPVQIVKDTPENLAEEIDQSGEVEPKEQTEENPDATENTVTEPEEETEDD